MRLLAIEYHELQDIVEHCDRSSPNVLVWNGTKMAQ